MHIRHQQIAQCGMRYAAAANRRHHYHHHRRQLRIFKINSHC